MNIDILGYKLNYEQLGSGEDLLILHGWGCDIKLFSSIAAEMSKSFKVTLVDLPGHGLSDIPQKTMTVYDYADVVLEFMNKLNINKANIFAHSFGCRLSIILAAKNPDRIGKMILCGAAGIKPKRGASYYAKVYSYKFAKFILKPFPKALKKYQSSKGSSDYKNLPESMKSTFSAIVNEDLTYLLKDIKSNVFLIWGELDTATPLYMAEIMEHTIPQCKKIVYAGRTHYGFLEELARTLAIANTFYKENL